jgi:hypothetical protein
MAASTSTTICPANDTDAHFRAICQFIHDGFSNAGWVQTSDTGQINLSTVTKPASTHTSQGYEIWKMNDGGGKQVWYVKIEYGGGGAAANFAIWITVGTGSNGSGTLTGQLSTRTEIYSAGNSTTNYNCYIAGNTSWLNFALFSTTASSSYIVMFGVERLKNADGTDNDNGVYWYGYGGSNSCASQVVLTSGTVPSAEPYVLSAMGYATGSSRISGTVCGTFPVFPVGKCSYPPCLSVVLFYYTDIAEGVAFSLSRYGTSHTYVAIRGGSSVMYFTGSGISFAPAMRYE